MNQVEFSGVMAALQEGIGRVFTDGQVSVWWDCTKDLDGRAFVVACKRWLCEVNSGFPSIAMIRQFALEHNQGQPETAADAWGRVHAAIGRLGYMRVKEARETLGETIWRVLGGAAGWDRLCESENIAIDKGQFRMAYESLIERETKRAALPDDVRPQQALPTSTRRIVENTAKLIGGVE